MKTKQAAGVLKNVIQEDQGEERLQEQHTYVRAEKEERIIHTTCCTGETPQRR